MSDHPIDNQTGQEPPERAGLASQAGRIVRATGRRSKAAYGQVRQAVAGQVSGLENLPSGGFIVAANHRWPNDFARLTLALGRKLWLAQPHPTTAHRGPRAVAQRLSARRGRQVPLGGNPGTRNALSLLRAGEVVVVFPEREPSLDAVLRRGYPDVAWLALTAQVPVLPAALLPSPAQQVAGAPALQQMLGPSVRLGEPLDLRRFWSVDPISDALDGTLLRGITDLVMAQIAELTQGGYRDAYADDQAPAGPAEPAPGQTGTADDRAGVLGWLKPQRSEQVTASAARRQAAQERFAREQQVADDLREARQAAQQWVDQAAVPTDWRTDGQPRNIATPLQPDDYQSDEDRPGEDRTVAELFEEPR